MRLMRIGRQGKQWDAMLLRALGAISLLLSEQVAAECFNSVGNVKDQTVVHMYVAGTTLIVDDNAPIGAEVGRLLVDESSRSPEAKTTNCNPKTGNLSIEFAPQFGGVATNTVYPSGIPGIGLRGTFNFGPVFFDLPYLAASSENYQYDPRDTLTIAFVKTGPLTSSGQVNGELIQYRWDQDGFIAARVTLTSPVVLQLQNPTCTVEAGSANQSVTLGSVARDKFTGMGSTGPGVPFTISLSCAGGNVGLSTHIQIGFSDASQPGNTSNVLSLAPTAHASGVGVQIRNTADQIISFGPDSTAWGSPGKWLAGSSGVGQFNINLSARFVQTEASITYGSADAIATFTLSYQ